MNRFIEEPDPVGYAGAQQTVIGQLSPDEIVRLSRLSSDIHLYGLLLLLFSLAAALIAYANLQNQVLYPLWPLGVSLIGSIAAYGSFYRPRWGRVVCMISALSMLPLMPLGTLVGYLGLRTALWSRGLFGAERLSHRELNRAVRAIPG